MKNILFATPFKLTLKILQFHCFPKKVSCRQQRNGKYGEEKLNSQIQNKSVNFFKIICNNKYFNFNSKIPIIYQTLFMIRTQPNQSREVLKTEMQGEGQMGDNRKRLITCPNIAYKGITLKDYFRLCDENEGNYMERIEEQSGRESEGGYTRTPAFGGYNEDEKKKGRQLKIKTEVQEKQDLQYFYKTKGLNKLNKPEHFYPIIGQKMSHTIEQKMVPSKKIPNNPHPLHYKPSLGPRRRVPSLSSKNNKQFLNQSTLTSFYQLHKNKQKMLSKLKSEKERANDLRLSEAFFITKYGGRFRLEENKQFHK